MIGEAEVSPKQVVVSGKSCESDVFDPGRDHILNAVLQQLSLKKIYREGVLKLPSGEEIFLPKILFDSGATNASYIGIAKNINGCFSGSQNQFGGRK